MAHRFLSGIDATTAVIHQPAYNSVAGKAFEVVCGAHLSLPASTEASDVVLGLNRTVQWANGDLTVQRAVVVRAPTYDFFGPGTASSIDVVATMAIEGPPIEGPNADFLETYTLWIQSGTLALGTSGVDHGSLRVNSSSGYGVTITSGHTTADYTLTLPIAQGGALTFLQNDGYGVLSWAAGGGGSAALPVTQVGFGSAGNVLTGASDFTWSSSNKQLSLPSYAGDGGILAGNFSFTSYEASESWITHNAYYNGGWRNRSNNFAGAVYFYNDKITIWTAAASIPGAITPVNQMEFRATGLPVIVSTVAPTLPAANEIIFGSGQIRMANLANEANLRIGDGGFMIQSWGTNDSWFGSNFFYNGASWKYRESNVAQRVYFYQGQVRLSTAIQGVTENDVTWIDGLVVGNTGKVSLLASDTNRATLNIPHGTAPNSPVDGDIWTTTLGMYAQIGGTTVGPFGDPSGPANDTISLQACAEGGSYTIAAGVNLVILEPTSTRNTFTLIMSAAPADGSSITILGGNFGVDNLTLSPNSGQTFVTGTAITTMGIGGRAAYEYKSSTARWYRRV